MNIYASVIVDIWLVLIHLVTLVVLVSLETLYCTSKYFAYIGNRKTMKDIDKLLTDIDNKLTDIDN